MVWCDLQEKPIGEEGRSNHGLVDSHVNSVEMTIGKEGDSTPMTLRGGWSRHAALISTVSCVMITLSFFLPWYGADYRASLPPYDGPISMWFFTDYTIGIWPPAGTEQVRDLMSIMVIVLTMSLAFSIAAAVLSCLGRRWSVVAAGACSAGLLLIAVVLFSIEVADALGFEHFYGLTRIDSVWSVETAPRFGWWLAVVASAVQGAQVVVLAHLGHRDSRKSP
jgi:hypothetical protein